MTSQKARLRILLRCLTLLGIALQSGLALPAHADPWKYSLEEALQVRTDQAGRERYSLNQEVIGYYLNRIASHARAYPPSFESDAQRQDISHKLRQLVDVLGVVAANDPELMLRYAFAQSMGHNLDFASSAREAIRAFEALLKADPDDRRANYRYGMFLASTAQSMQAFPYLEKALKAGEEDARYTLGLLELQHRDRDRGLHLLEQYTRNVPENPHALRTLAAAREGRLSFHQDSAPAAAE
jgi:predicted Zn-dependent protease